MHDMRLEQRRDSLTSGAAFPTSREFFLDLLRLKNTRVHYCRSEEKK